MMITMMINMMILSTIFTQVWIPVLLLVLPSSLLITDVVVGDQVRVVEMFDDDNKVDDDYVMCQRTRS